jgi:outer membrane protein OmpA-like peptidoglycan-associated protein
MRKAFNLTAAIFAFVLPSLASADCNSLVQELKQAQKSGNSDLMFQSAEQIQIESSCSDAYRIKVGRSAANAIAKLIQNKSASGKTREHELKRALKLSRVWVALAMLGDHYIDTKNYPEASKYFQEALLVINDEVATPNPPSKKIIESIFHKAAETRMLADSYVEVPTTRSGGVSGLALPSVRGWSVEKVPIPITFHTDSTRFTNKGDSASRDLLSYLNKQGTKKITLIGHTDARGDANYNQKLSLKRAKALARWLVEAGFSGEIETRGSGETQPLKLDDPGRYSQQEIWQLNRRVELQWN